MKEVQGSIVCLKGNNESWEEDKLDDARKNVGSLEQLSKHFGSAGAARAYGFGMRQRSEGNDDDEQEALDLSSNSLDRLPPVGRRSSPLAATYLPIYLPACLPSYLFYSSLGMHLIPTITLLST